MVVLESLVFLVALHVAWLSTRTIRETITESPFLFLNLLTVAPDPIAATNAKVLDSPGDAGDAIVADEGESESFTEAELDAGVLRQVRDALERIEDGTFGRCVVDGEPIEPKRLVSTR